MNEDIDVNDEFSCRSKENSGFLFSRSLFFPFNMFRCKFFSNNYESFSNIIYEAFSFIKNWKTRLNEGEQKPRVKDEGEELKQETFTKVSMCKVTLHWMSEISFC